MTTLGTEPIDELLLACRALGLNVRANPDSPDGPWRAQCPICRPFAAPDELALAITKSGHLRCAHRCDSVQIADALYNAIPSNADSPRGGTQDHVRQGPRSEGWPAPMSDAAFQGIVGTVVRAIEPHTEADSNAILVQALVAFGNLLGRTARFAVEADEHHANLYAVIVGETSKGRKGTGLSHVRRLISMADSDYVQRRVVGGLSTGEGLVWAVRDATMKLIKDDPTGEWSEQMTEPGIEDKRLLVVESEFAQALKVMARPGNTLSPALRGLWDHGSAGMLTKHDPTKTTGAHVSIIGHIVRDELRRELNATEQANGLANRILFCCARRSKLLPDGGHFEADANFAFEISGVIAEARRIGLGPALERDTAAQSLWVSVYPELSEGTPGLLGAVIGRAEAQVTRLALLYATLDGRQQIGLAHLQAALEVWRYCENSARYIFGNATGDPVADEILTALVAAGTRGMTRTEIRDLFSRHRTDRIGAALTTLTTAGLVTCDKQGTAGRPAERWYAVEQKRAGS